MDAGIYQHLAIWAEREFSDDTEREEVISLLTNLWNADEEYWQAGTHSWWELLGIARRQQMLK